MSISLAALKYDQSMFEKFFETISIRRHSLLDGTMVYTANSYLKPELQPEWKESNRLYSTCDGSGTSVLQNQAIYKAISEGLERLVFYQHFDSTDYGFNLDCSTNGLAAFPGIFKSSARKLAYNEAVERWSISEFWKGNLAVESIEEKGKITHVVLKTPFPGVFTSICFFDFIYQDLSLRAYGFASSQNKRTAFFRALIELSRNHEVLTQDTEEKSSMELNLTERRLLYFSKEKGIKRFEETLSRAMKNSQNTEAPKIIVDSSIVGSWSPYCFVHRVLFDGMNTSDLHEDTFAF